MAFLLREPVPGCRVLHASSIRGLPDRWCLRVKFDRIWTGNGMTSASLPFFIPLLVIITISTRKYPRLASFPTCLHYGFIIGARKKSSRSGHVTKTCASAVSMIRIKRRQPLYLAFLARAERAGRPQSLGLDSDIEPNTRWGWKGPHFLVEVCPLAAGRCSYFQQSNKSWLKRVQRTSCAFGLGDYI
jgi:hypothetical protein